MIKNGTRVEIGKGNTCMQGTAVGPVYGNGTLVNVAWDGVKKIEVGVKAGTLRLAMAMPELEVAGVVDCTPTWSGVLPVYLAALEARPGTHEGRKAAREEITRMAKLADLYVASQPKAKSRG